MLKDITTIIGISCIIQGDTLIVATGGISKTVCSIICEIQSIQQNWHKKVPKNISWVGSFPVGRGITYKIYLVFLPNILVLKLVKNLNVRNDCPCSKPSG